MAMPYQLPAESKDSLVDSLAGCWSSAGRDCLAAAAAHSTIGSLSLSLAAVEVAAFDL